MTKTTPPATPKRPRTDAARLPFVWAAASHTKEGELYRRISRDLRAHIGGNPTAAQELLIGRIAWLQVHMARIDERAMRDGGLSAHATREYLAWHNTIARSLSLLGLNGTPDKPQSPDQILAEIHSRFGRRTDTEGAE